MNRNQTKSFFKSSMGIVILLLCAINSYSIWTINYSELGFKKTAENETSLETYIQQGAVCFLDSYSNTMQYMIKTESIPAEGINVSELKSILEKAVSSMRLSNDYYKKLNSASENIPYNPVIIDALRNFDYDSFIKSNDGYINKSIVDDVKSYLVSGDIRGIYSKMVLNTEQLIILLNRLIEATDSGVIPSMPDTWKTNHLFSQTLLFGQYTTQVFACISKNAQ